MIFGHEYDVVASVALVATPDDPSVDVQAMGTAALLEDSKSGVASLVVLDPGPPQPR